MCEVTHRGHQLPRSAVWKKGPRMLRVRVLAEAHDFRAGWLLTEALNPLVGNGLRGPQFRELGCGRRELQLECVRMSAKAPRFQGKIVLTGVVSPPE